MTRLTSSQLPFLPPRTRKELVRVLAETLQGKHQSRSLNLICCNLKTTTTFQDATLRCCSKKEMLLMCCLEMFGCLSNMSLHRTSTAWAKHFFLTSHTDPHRTQDVFHLSVAQHQTSQLSLSRILGFYCSPHVWVSRP